MKKLTFEVPDCVWEKASPMIGPENKYRNITEFLNASVKELLKRNGVRVFD